MRIAIVTDIHGNHLFEEKPAFLRDARDAIWAAAPAALIEHEEAVQ